MSTRIAVRHIYETPEVYDLIYGRNNGYKLGEAYAFAYVLQRSKLEPKSMLELFSGVSSYHKRHFLDYYAQSGQKAPAYFCMDAAASDEDGTIHVQDAVEEDWGKTFDAVTAHFFSASSIVNFQDGLVKRAHTTKLFANVWAHLNKGGVFLLDSCADGYISGTQYTDELRRGIVREYSADPNSKLVESLKGKHKLKPNDWVTLKVTMDCHYDRATSNNIDVFKKVEAYINDKKVRTYSYELPFCQRYFSEPELRDMLVEAGFKTVKGWRCDYKEHDFSRVEDVLTYDKDLPEDEREDEREINLPNVFVAYK